MNNFQIQKIKYIFYKFYFAIIAMPNLPSVSYMIGEFQNAISGTKTQRGGKSFRKL